MRRVVSPAPIHLALGVAAGLGLAASVKLELPNFAEPVSITIPSRHLAWKLGPRFPGPYTGPGWTSHGDSDRGFVVNGESRTEANERRDRIVSELTRLVDHDWAGRYYSARGSDANSYLDVAPQSGFVFEAQGWPDAYDRNWGGVRIERDVLELEPAFPNERIGREGIATSLIPVHWGERHYLVALDSIVDFFDWEPRNDEWGRVLLRYDDWAKPAFGEPIFPPRFAAHIERRAFVASVIGVLDSKLVERDGATWRTTRVTIDFGKELGAFVGMGFYLGDERDRRSLAIVELAENSSIAEYSHPGADSTKPELGWKFRSRPASEDRR